MQPYAPSSIDTPAASAWNPAGVNIRKIDGVSRANATASAVARSMADGPPEERWLCHVPKQ